MECLCDFFFWDTKNKNCIIVTRGERHTCCHSGAVCLAQALTFPPVCCFAVGVGRTRWTGSCPPLGPLAGRAPPRWANQSLLFSARARAPSTQPVDPPCYDEQGAQPKEAFVIGTMMFLHLLTVKLQLWAGRMWVFFFYCSVNINTLLPSHMHTARQH